MFESKGEKLIPFPRFLGRVAISVLITLGLVIIALSIGTCGYHFIAGLGWIDAELNATMILTGMGPVDSMKTNASKIFASCYALFSGVVFFTCIGIVLTPVFHRFIHKFHLDNEDEDSPEEPKSKDA